MSEEETKDAPQEDKQEDAPSESKAKPKATKSKKVTNAQVLEHVTDMGERLEKVVNVLSSFDERIQDMEKKREQDVSPDIRLANQKKAEEDRNIAKRKNSESLGDNLKTGEDMVDIAPPPGLRGVLDEILGDEFGLIVQQGKFNASLHATILVPREFSDLNDDNWRMKQCDPRTVPINQATAEQDFRKHCWNVKAHIERTALKNTPLKSLYNEGN